MATPLLVSEMDLRPLVDDPASMDGAIDALEQATVRYYQGKVRERGFVDQTGSLSPNTVVQLSFAADDEQLCGYQMFAEESSGMAVTLANARFVTLLDPETRQLRAIVDYRSLSPLRVGATAGIGLRYLAPAGARVAGILGSAQQARGQLQAIARTVPDLELVRVYSPTPAHREAFAREMTAWLELKVEPVATARAATEGADVIAVANASGASILDLSWVRKGGLVISIGGSRMPSEVLRETRVVASTWDRLVNREPYASAIKAGTYTRSDLAAELAELTLGTATARRDSNDVVIFELGVINNWAVATADWAYRWAVKQGAGTAFTLSSDE